MRLDEIKHHNDVIQLFKNETDRSVAILGAIHLDNLLEVVLRAYFADPKANDIKGHGSGQDAISRLFAHPGALSTFSSRMDIGLAVGVLSRLEHEDLTIIRRIRNGFAHNLESQTFTFQSVQSQCANLSVTRAIVKSPHEIEKFPEFQGARQQYIWAVGTLAMILMRRAHEVPSRTLPPSREWYLLPLFPDKHWDQTLIAAIDHLYNLLMFRTTHGPEPTLTWTAASDYEEETPDSKDTSPEGPVPEQPSEPSGG